MEPPSAPPRRGHGPWQGLLLAASLLTLWSPPTTAQLTVESVPSNAAQGKDVPPEGRGAAAGTMEPPSAPPRRGHGPWQGLLLAASLLTLWSPPTTAQLTVESVPSNAAQGKDVLLLVHNLPDNLIRFRWYKGNKKESHQLIASYSIANRSTIPGPVYSHRETIYPNGSLLFQNVTLNDTGSYTFETINVALQSTEASGSFHVYSELSKPFIISNSSQAAEGEDSVALTCAPETQDTAYLWWVNVPVTKPSIHSSNTTVMEHDSVALTCLSNDTGISIRWIFRDQSLQLTDRMKLSQDNSTLTIDPVSRNDAGEYQCEVSNSASASRSGVLRLDVILENTSGLPAGAIAGIVIGVLVAVALVAALVCFLRGKRTGRADVQHGPREPQSMASTPGHGPSGGCTARAPLPGHRTAVPIYEDLLNPDLDVYCGINHKAEVAS